CPHHQDGNVPDFSTSCHCRKPQSALFEKAAQEMKLDLAHSFWVGDRRRDLMAAEKFGGRSILLTTGYGLKEASDLSAPFQPNLVAPSLMRAAQWIIAEKTNG
ncbi:MAG: HAD hydrolase-like protein, partial [Candidatus Adiutrix sp.]